MLIIDVRPNGSIYLSVYAPDSTREPYARYSFADWRHFLAYFGAMLPLLAVPVYVHHKEN